ncbi:unnamed protein product, partial [Scytosiphon promiscuus]
MTPGLPLAASSRSTPSMHFHAPWRAHHALGFGLAFLIRYGEGFSGIAATSNRGIGQHQQRRTATALSSSSTSPLPPPDRPTGSRTTTTPPPSRELIQRERERWGHGTARAVERGLDEQGRGGSKKASGKKPSAAGGKKKGPPRRPKAKGDRGRGPMVLCWRMYNVELSIDEDPGKDFSGVSPELLAVVMAKLGIEGEGVLVETDIVVARKSFDARTKRVKNEREPRFSYTLDVRLSPKVARKLRLRTKQGKLEPSPSGGPLFPASPSADPSAAAAVSDISPDIASAAVSKMASLSDETSAALAAEAAAADAAAVSAASAKASGGTDAAAAAAAAAADDDDDDGVSETDREVTAAVEGA